jgi:anti-anti-sigma factor
MADPAHQKHIDVQRTKRSVILAPDANLTGDAATEELLRIFDTLEKEEPRCIIVDLNEVEFINSLALGVVISGHVRLTRQGCRFVLCNVNDRIKKVLVITKLMDTLVIFDARGDAVVACDGDESGLTGR